GREIRGSQSAQQFLDRRQSLLGRLELPAETQLVRSVESITLRLAFDQLQELQRLDLRAFRETHVAAFGAGLDLSHAELLCEQLQRRDREQRLQRRWQQAETVDQLHLQLVELRVRASVGNAFVMHETHVDVGHVVFGNQ